MVLAHARALLASGPQGVTDYLDADLRKPGDILDRAKATLDFTQPIAVMMIGILHLIGDQQEPHAIVRQVMAALPRGSWLAILHPASDVGSELGQMTVEYNKRSATPATLRSRDQVAGFFEGLDLLPPGLVHLGCWEQGIPAPAGAAEGSVCRVRRWGWSPQDHAPVRAAEVSDERGSARRPDLDVRAEGGERQCEGRGIGVLEVEGLKGQPVRC